MAKSKWSSMTTQLWRNPEVASLSMEARGLFMELVMWQLEQGFIPDDPLYFERLYGRLCSTDFHASWAEVTGILARTDKGFVSPFVAQVMEAESQAKEEARQRQSKKRSKDAKSCHAVSRVTSRDLPPPSPSPLLSPTPPINSSPLTPSPSSPEGAEPKVSAATQREFLDWWKARWKQARGTEYLIQAKDAVSANKLLKAASMDEVKRRAELMLDHQDAWMAARASLTTLLGQWNQLVAKSPQNAAQRVTVGQPPRSSDDELRDEWEKWNSRVRNAIPPWVGSEQARQDIEMLKEIWRKKNAAKAAST
jgi:hypothetical protein